MSSSLSKIPPGVQYIFDREAKLRRSVERQVMEIFAGWSYSEIILPIYDYADLFALGMGKDQAEMTYRFTGQDGKLLALRPELTSLVARTVATRLRESPRPIRLCYSGEVFRWDQPRGGRQYEFHQIGLEHIGSDRLEADTEVLIVAIEALRALGLDNFKITLGHVDFFHGIAEQLELGANDRRQMGDLIDRRQVDKLEEFLRARVSGPMLEPLHRVITLSGGPEVIQLARDLERSPRLSSALDDLERVYNIVHAIGIDRYVEIDLGDVGGLDYYTGLTFKIYVPGLGTALGRGGRYDRLLEQFNLPEPAVGFSFCLDWLAQLLASTNNGTALLETSPASRLSATGDLVSVFKEATRLRKSGVRVEIV
jgi:ATP phosphoribosyltransferase regulatory subunit